MTSGDGSPTEADGADATALRPSTVEHVTGVAPQRRFDHDAIRQAVRTLFRAIGEDRYSARSSA